ncbi:MULTISPECIES: hypothetical protein [unclassified Bradyrhizobium]|uniref:hypothetical protein n=1 Tax=unclassified Bradyrhizobium TaxID=2631580 RepID=UPI0028EFDEA8|nr:MULTISPECIES: hypothetical protein [unclassified Bradyrhizobium]
MVRSAVGQSLRTHDPSAKDRVARPAGQIAAAQAACTRRDVPAHPRGLEVDCGPNRMRRKTHFARRFKHIALAGHSSKKISVSFFQKSCFPLVRPVSQEGRFAVVTNVEAGCGGRVDVAAWLSRADERR